MKGGNLEIRTKKQVPYIHDCEKCEIKKIIQAISIL